ncbi:MAG: hypothetical protein L0216_19885 [Planctomycetales bacterium]|nr:hypothetical protein [Planctomycetales bacterium]
MTSGADAVLAGVAVTNFWLLGASRLGHSIRVTAAQGILLGFLPLLAAGADGGALSLRVLALVAASVLLKGLLFPRLLFRGIREASIRREIEPYVGFTTSLVLGLVLLAVSLGIGTRLPLPHRPVSTLAVPIALFTMLSGLFLIVSRRKALTQVLGYLVLEDGIYAFGVLAVGEIPLLVEFGVLLDAFVAVFAMGIAIHRIHREFDHIDADRLKVLRG